MGYITKTVGAVLGFFVALTHSHAQLLVDDFSIEGGLTGTIPDVGGIWTTNPVTTSGQIKVIGGKATVPVTGWELLTSSFPQQSGNTTYAGFTFNYDTMTGSPAVRGPAMVGGVGIMMGDSYYYNPEGPGGFVLLLNDGISNDVSQGLAGLTFRWPVSLNLNTDYRLVLGFTENGNQDQLTLWVNPVGTGSTSVSGLVGSISTGVSGFLLEEHGHAGRYSVDDLYVGSSFAAAAGLAPLPEPSVGLLLVSTLVVLPRLRRIRRKHCEA